MSKRRRRPVSYHVPGKFRGKPEAKDEIGSQDLRDEVTEPG